MKILNKITLQNLFLNKKRNIVTIIGIILSVALITAVATMVLSARKSLIEYTKKEQGDYHILLKDVSLGDFKYLKSNRNFEKVYYSKEIGYAKLNESKNEYKPYAYIISYDKIGLDSLKSNIVEGRMPQNDSEILISTSLKDNGRIYYKIGDSITFELGKRISEGYELSQSSPYLKDEEEFISNNISKTYKIVGIMERPNNAIEPYSAPGYTFITLDDRLDNDINVYARFNKKGLNDMSESLYKLLNVKKETLDIFYFVGGSREERKKYLDNLSEMKYELVVNNYLLSSEKLDLKSSTMGPLYAAGGVAILIIIATSVYCIKNAFDISLTEKTKQFGILSSIGATKRQIKKIVLKEAKYLGLVGIPLGILFGILASYILILISNAVLYDYLNVKLKLVISILSLLISMILSIVTLYLSSIKSAIKASKMSPLSAIRGNEDIKIKNKKYKTPKLINKLFGIGGVVSHKNLKRNKKKYRTAIVSIIVCVTAFIPLSNFIDTLFKVVKLSAAADNYVISITPNKRDESFDKYVDRIVTLDKVKGYSVTKGFSFLISNDDYFTKDYIKANTKNYCIDGECYYNALVIALGDKPYREYVDELNLNYNDIKDKAIAINKVNKQVPENGKMVKKRISKLNQNNKKISGMLTDSNQNDITIEIGAYTSEYPVSYISDYTDEVVLVLSDKEFNKYSDENDYTIYLDTKDASFVQNQIEQLLKDEDYLFTNVQESEQALKSLFLLLSIFLYGFITVVSLIGITNIFNTITTSMNLRRREFATLKSIGMTSKEFYKMIALENIFYIFKSLIISIPLGTIISYFMHKLINDGDMYIEFIFPIKAILIVSVSVTLVLFIIMKYSISKLKDQNIIETIRNDNI